MCNAIGTGAAVLGRVSMEESATLSSMTPRSIIFLGTSSFAVPTLRALAADKSFTIELVVTQPDRPVGRKQLLTPSPIKEEALKLGLAIAQPEKIKELQVPRPDFLLVISYGQILPEEILALPTIAPINIHASLLPRWRGASPIQHAILNGDEESGVTVQRMVSELDAGPILSVAKTSIEPRETYQTLHDRLALMGAELAVQTLKKPLLETAQEEAKITLCRKLKKEDGNADAKIMDAETIDRMVRALTPWPGVVIGDAKILETSLTQGADDLPFPCANGTTIFIRKIQPASGKPMTGKAFGLGRTL